MVNLILLNHYHYHYQFICFIIHDLSSLPTSTNNNKKAPTTHRNRGLKKKGSYLLSHIALQYHRRNWA